MREGEKLANFSWMEKTLLALEVLSIPKAGRLGQRERRVGAIKLSSWLAAVALQKNKTKEERETTKPR